MQPINNLPLQISNQHQPINYLSLCCEIRIEDFVFYPPSTHGSLEDTPSKSNASSKDAGDSPCGSGEEDAGEEDAGERMSGTKTPGERRRGVDVGEEDAGSMGVKKRDGKKPQRPP